ncbi:MAG: UDP-N-acetylmuramoyl-L-alanyl-D-glutamate--2,6-diaminopimelate ligase [Betaproteobacteria bacterium]|nr:UDP-N-acetylmuramoyl-L-alanyl-D-glutamate--2,6-diaminopimelate ligase [Betaproteobacteria bacterium]MDE2621949.1 UDP-N-acetylmuramoyl-L-alanyl-D-glutamate--2,6-diaminopimelate ligase [Betaproteobacteria bacterium]
MVLPGMTFVAYPGTHVDGRQFIPHAIERGAAAVLWERDGFYWHEEWSVPNQGIQGLRAQVSGIASQVCGNPSHHLWVVGITGTNGKTSCSHWLAQLMQASGKSCVVVGTLGNGWLDHLESAQNTTPDAIALQESLARFSEAGAWGCAMEVSSHGLEQERVSGVRFRGAVFTNLSQDHLDYHGSMEAYGAAKALLFQSANLEFAVLNLDDPFGYDLARRTVGTGPQVIGYTTRGTNPPAGVRLLSASGIAMRPECLEFTVDGGWGQVRVQAPLVGHFNVSNLLAVMAAALMGGLALDQVASAVARLQAPPGRLEQLGGHGLPVVVVDYAHSPDALEKALSTLRGTMTPGHRLICVFGCGGNRDIGKRPLMGAIAERLADQVILTSDNPRDEPPEEILDQISAGMAGVPLRVSDRSEAIRKAIALASPGDVVLIAGKGHEITQEIAGRKLPFSDRVEAQRCLDEVKN